MVYRANRIPRGKASTTRTTQAIAQMRYLHGANLRVARSIAWSTCTFGVEEIHPSHASTRSTGSTCLDARYSPSRTPFSREYAHMTRFATAGRAFANRCGRSACTLARSADDSKAARAPTIWWRQSAFPYGIGLVFRPVAVHTFPTTSYGAGGGRRHTVPVSEILGFMIGDWWSRRRRGARAVDAFQRDGSLDSGLRVVEGAVRGLSSEWLHGTWCVAANRLRCAGVVVDVEGVEEGVRRPTMRESWSVDPDADLVALRCTGGRIEWALPSGLRDAALSRLRGDAPGPE